MRKCTAWRRVLKTSNKCDNKTILSDEMNAQMIIFASHHAEEANSKSNFIFHSLQVKYALDDLSMKRYQEWVKAREIETERWNKTEMSVECLFFLFNHQIKARENKSEDVAYWFQI